MRERRKRNVTKMTIVELCPSEEGGVTGQPGDRGWQGPAMRAPDVRGTAVCSGGGAQRHRVGLS